MKTIQLITHNDRPAAIVAGDTAIVADHVAGDDRARVQAMCLYAMEISAGTQPGPYSDELAEQYADEALARPGTARRGRLAASRRPAHLAPSR
jgi:hypothetical protein